MTADACKRIGTLFLGYEFDLRLRRVLPRFCMRPGRSVSTDEFSESATVPETFCFSTDSRHEVIFFFFSEFYVKIFLTEKRFRFKVCTSWV